MKANEQVIPETLLLLITTKHRHLPTVQTLLKTNKSKVLGHHTIQGP